MAGIEPFNKLKCLLLVGERILLSPGGYTQPLSGFSIYLSWCRFRFEILDCKITQALVL